MNLPVPQPRLPAPADTHPVPDEGGLPPLGRVDFVLFGYTRPDGMVELIGSRDVPWAEITTETVGDDLRWTWDRLYQPPMVHTLTARLKTYAWTIGADLRAALAALGDVWTP